MASAYHKRIQAQAASRFESSRGKGRRTRKSPTRGELGVGELEKVLAVASRSRKLRELSLGGQSGPSPAWTAELALVSAPKMAALNAKFRKKEGPTDVLSFPAPGPVRRLGMLGELVICLPVLVRQAREQGHPPERELRVLLVHGVLHLLGLDHERGPEEAALQRHWETVLLRRLDSGSSAASRSALGLIARAEPAAKGRGRRASPRRKPRGRRA